MTIPGKGYKQVRDNEQNNGIERFHDEDFSAYAK
jgi:hypothetical protein